MLKRKSVAARTLVFAFGGSLAAVLSGVVFAHPPPPPPPPPPAPGFCHETVNPAANPAVGDNGVSDDPFGGDAVPGGTSTSPGTRGNGPINPDGFYLVGGLLFSDTTPIEFPGGGFVWPDNTTIKYTERGNPDIRITSSIGGPKSAISYHVQAPGDLYVDAPQGDPDAVFCGVPPPPF